ncbi:hypothetical protein ABIE41_000828 [Bosea sp. OAE506]|uniref:hypothetical protein n=1 Tax=Bosea sp. OAE506 TaxID=2663870 RepID=UPI003391604D
MLGGHRFRQGGTVGERGCAQPGDGLVEILAVRLLDLGDDRGRVVGSLDGGLRLAAIGADAVACDQQRLVGLDQIRQPHVFAHVAEGLGRHIGQCADTRNAQASHGGDEVILDRGWEELHGHRPGRCDIAKASAFDIAWNPDPELAVE